MELYLVRHGIAEDRTEFSLKLADDSQRPLTVEGKKKFEKVIVKLKKLIGPIDLIVSSPFLRAQQTAKIVSALYPQTKFKTSKSLEPAALLEEFVKWTDLNVKNKKARVMIVGHEPHLSLLASWLLFGVDYSRMIVKKGGCLAISNKESIGPSTGILSWAVTPKSLGVR